MQKAGIDIPELKGRGQAGQRDLYKDKMVRDLVSQQRVRSILDQLRPYTSKLIEVCTKLKLYAEIECVIYLESQVPAIYFDQDVVKRTAELNAEIDVDLYTLPDPEEDTSQ